MTAGHFTPADSVFRGGSVVVAAVATEGNARTAATTAHVKPPTTAPAARPNIIDFPHESLRRRRVKLSCVSSKGHSHFGLHRTAGSLTHPGRVRLCARDGVRRWDL